MINGMDGRKDYFSCVMSDEEPREHRATLEESELKIALHWN